MWGAMAYQVYLGLKGRWFERHRRYCVVSFSKTLYPLPSTESTCKTIKHIKYRTSDGGRTFSTIGYTSTCKLIRTAIRRVARQRPGSLDLNYIGFI